MRKKNIRKNVPKPVSTNVPGSYLNMMKDISGGSTYSKGLKVARNLYKLAVHEPSASFETQLIGYSTLYESFLTYAGARVAEVIDYDKDMDHPMMKADILSSIDAIIEEDGLDESDVKHGCWIAPTLKRDEMRRFSIRLKADDQLLYSEMAENVNDGILKVLAFYEDVVYRHVKGWKEKRLYLVYKLFQDDIILQLSDRLTKYLKKNDGRNPATLTDSLCSWVDLIVDRYAALDKGR